MEQIKLKVQKSSRIIGNFLNIVKVLMIIIIALGFIMVGLAAFTSDEFYAQMQREAFGAGTSSEISVMEGSLSVIVEEFTKQNFIGMGIYVILTGVLMTIQFDSLHRIFKDIGSNYTPFNMKNVKRIKLIGIVVAFSSLILYCVSNLLIGPDLFTFSFSDLLIGAAIFCLAYVFEYGCMLQKQSDETL